MKRFLQKSLFRLQTLLLLAVMFVVGGSAAWADTGVEFNFFYNENGQDGLTKDNVTLEFDSSWGWYYSYGKYYGSTGSPAIHITSAVGEIDHVTVDDIEITTRYQYSATRCTTTSGTFALDSDNYRITYTPENGVQDMTIGVGIYSGAAVTRVIVYLKEIIPDDPIDYHVVFVNAPNGASATVDGTSYTSNSDFSVQKNLTIDNITNIVEPDGWYATKAYDSISKTFTITYYQYYVYTVAVVGTESANAGVRYDDQEYYNGDEIQKKTALEESNFAILDVNGYNKATNVEITGSDYAYTVTANYTRAADITYHVEFVGAPEGASATINGEDFDANNEYTTNLTLDENDLEFTEPDGYWGQKSYNSNTHTYTVTYHEYFHYTVTVVGTDDANAGVIYNGETYKHEDVISTRDAFANTDGMKAANIVGCMGTVSLSNMTISVEYEKVNSVTFDFTESNTFDVAGINCSSTVSSFGRGINIWNDESLTISSVLEIEKIAFPSFEPYDSEKSPSDFSRIGTEIGTWKDDNNYNAPATWNAPTGCTTVTFKKGNSTSDFVIANIIVYFRQPIDYTIDLVDAPDGASVKVNNDDTLGADGTYTTTSELNENSIVANCPETHYAEVEYTEANHTFTVTFKPWYIYNVSVNQMMGAVTYDGNSYYANEDQIKSKTAIDENDFEAYDLDGYDESVSVSGSDHTFTVTVTYTESAPENYYIVFPEGTPAGTRVIIDGNSYTAGDTYSTAFEVNYYDFGIIAPDGYYADETSNCYDADSRTFTVRVYEYYHYTVNVTGCDEGRAVVGGYSYAQDQKIESKTLLTESEVSTLPVARYDADFTINGDGHNYTIDVVYTAYPTLAIHSTSTDKEGNYWTSFCYNRPISLPAGFIPCIVTGAENGVLTIHEFEGENTETNVMYDFRPRGSVEKIGGNLYIEGNNHDLSVSVSGCSIYESYSNDGRLENEGTLTFSHPENISKIIVTPYGDGYGANISLDGASPVNVGNDAYTFDVNASSCVMNLTSNGNGVYIFAIEVVVGTDNTPVIPANTAILIKSDTENANINYTVHEEGDVNTDVSANILSASGETGFSVVNDNDHLYYMLSLNAASEEGSLAFYWGKNSDNGHSITMPANKAYLMLPVSAGSSNRMLISGGYDETPTAIDGVVEISDDAPIFNLQGKRVSRENLSAGVYVKNGRKFIVK